VSQRVFPRRLAAEGFEFRHPDAATAVAALVKRGSRAGSRAC
jgi:NAD dependent epimerase/dehydratase family enzyme